MPLLRQLQLQPFIIYSETKEHLTAAALAIDLCLAWFENKEKCNDLESIQSNTTAHDMAR